MGGDGPDDGSMTASALSGGAHEDTEPGAPRRASSDLPVVSPGDCLGRYTVRAHLGSGGMGQVFEGFDPELQRVVALKLLRPDRLGSWPRMRARLVREAQALARLRHPNVVTVYDVGRQGDQTFVAMALARGPTVVEWLAARPRTWREVRDTFLAAGRGLAAAHSAGIIHRDFKPANVVVGKEHVVVLDFGLARSSAERADDEGDATPPPDSSDRLALDLTLTGERLGTPHYMAPEQLHGGLIDERSDQFAFCVSLWEALHGQRPGPALSNGVLPTAPRGTLVPAWLSAVVLRGLAADPARRWPSMHRLLEALARDPAATRRRTALAAALVGLALSVGGALWVTARTPPRADPCGGGVAEVAPLWPRNDAARARVAAAFQATGRPHAADTFARVDAALRGRLDRWAAAHRETCEATGVRHTQSDTMLDLRMACLGRARAEIGALISVLGEVDDVGLDRATRATATVGDVEACADTAALGRRAPPSRNPALSEELAAATARLGALWELGKAKEGLAAGRALVPRARALGDVTVLAPALFTTARFETDFGDAALAVDELYEAVRAAGEAGDDATAARALIQLNFTIGYRQHKFDAADVAYRLAASAVAQAGNRRRELIGLNRTRATVRYAMGDYVAALAHLQLARVLVESSPEPDRGQLALILGDTADALDMAGYATTVAPLYERAIATASEALGPNHPVIASLLNNEGMNQLNLLHYDAAAPLLERALGLKESLTGPESPSVAVTLHNLGLARLGQRRLGEARALLERAIRIREAKLGLDHPLLATSYGVLAGVRRVEGDPAGALELYDRALAIKLKAYGPEHPSVVIALGEKAKLLVARERFAEARPLVEQALASVVKSQGQDSPGQGWLLTQLGRILLAEKSPDEALRVARRAAALEERRYGADSPALYDCLTLLSEALVAEGQGVEGIAVARRAVGVTAGKLTPDVGAQARFQWARAEWSLGHHAHAVELARQARAAVADLPFAAEELGPIDRWLATHTAP